MIRKLVLALFLVCCVNSLATAETVTFKPAAGDVFSPERGFYRSWSNDFAKINAAALADIRTEGYGLTYAIFRLDAFRNRMIPKANLAEIDAALGRTRNAGLKVFLRFAYNYPNNETDYLKAKDASLAQVLKHIVQLAPIVAKNRDVILSMHAGFIGAWGEAHTSSKGLDTPGNKQKVVAALLKHMPKDLFIQWRYPADVFPWIDSKLPGVERVGLHNDCFLSSPSDVGTYDEIKSVRDAQRKRAQKIASTTVYSGETCAADPKEIRTSCKYILNEGAGFHLTSLNRDYYETFFEVWQKEGCLKNVTSRLGYRLRLLEATVSSNLLQVKLVNEGWARPVTTRKILARVNGVDVVLGTRTLDTINPRETVILEARIASGAKEICLLAPDPRLGADPRYALRFANADDAAKRQIWNGASGTFCFAVH